MRRFQSLGAALGVAGGLLFGAPQAAMAFTYHLDFDTDPQGNAMTDAAGGSLYGISTQWQDWGVTLSATNKAGTEPAPLLLFDSNPGRFTGGDGDLRSGAPWGTEVQNNVLIIHEDGFKGNGTVRRAGDPDDQAAGGVISFAFDRLVDLQSIRLLDVDDFDDRGPHIAFTAYGGAGETLGTSLFDSAALADPARVTNLSTQGLSGDNSLYDFALAYSDVARLDVLYPGSGAIASLSWSEANAADTAAVPEPTALLGLLAVAGISYRRWRVS